MSNKRRFLKLDRQIGSSAIWNDGTPFDKAHAWMDLLLYVNYIPKNRMFGNTIVHVKRGQTVTSDNFLAHRWNWSRSRVRRFLEMLEADNMIRLERTSYGTWISIVNYTKYQGEWTPSDTSNDTTVDTSVDTSNDTQLIESIESNENAVESFFCAGALKKIPPEKSDVEAYCREKRYRGMDIDGFFEYYDLRDWKLTGGLKMPDWTKAVDYWHSKGKKDAEKGQSDVVYFREFEGGPAIGGDAVPFKGGLAAEMLRRKREKNAR